MLVADVMKQAAMELNFFFIVKLLNLFSKASELVLLTFCLKDW